MPEPAKSAPKKAQEGRHKDRGEGEERSAERPGRRATLSTSTRWWSRSSWHRDLFQGDGDHELFRQRHLRAHRRWIVSSRSLQQALHHHFQRDPDRRASAAARGAGQTRRVWGHQGRHQVHQLQVEQPETVRPPKGSFKSHPSTRLRARFVFFVFLSMEESARQLTPMYIKIPIHTGTVEWLVSFFFQHIYVIDQAKLHLIILSNVQCSQSSLLVYTFSPFKIDYNSIETIFRNW